MLHGCGRAAPGGGDPGENPLSTSPGREIVSKAPGADRPSCCKPNSALSLTAAVPVYVCVFVDPREPAGRQRNSGPNMHEGGAGENGLVSVAACNSAAIARAASARLEPPLGAQEPGRPE